MINSTPQTNMDKLELQRKRLQYRSAHRGCKETDLVFERFSDRMLTTLDASGLSAYERLLDENDADIWNWLIAKDDVPEDYGNLMDLMRKAVSAS